MKIYYAFIWIAGQIPNDNIHNIEHIKQNYNVLSQIKNCNIELLFCGDSELLSQIKQNFKSIKMHHVPIFELVYEFPELKKFIEISLVGKPYYAFIADFLRILLMIYGLKDEADHVIYIDTDNYLLDCAKKQMSNIVNKKNKYICINKPNSNINNDLIIANSKELLADFFKYAYFNFLQIKIFDKKRMYDRMNRYIFYTDLFEKYYDDDKDEVPIVQYPASFEWSKNDNDFLNDYIVHAKCINPVQNIINSVVGDILLDIAVCTAGPQCWYDYFEFKEIEYFYEANNMMAHSKGTEVIDNVDAFEKFKLFKYALRMSTPNVLHNSDIIEQIKHLTFVC